MNPALTEPRTAVLGLRHGRPAGLADPPSKLAETGATIAPAGNLDGFEFTDPDAGSTTEARRAPDPWRSRTSG